MPCSSAWPELFDHPAACDRTFHGLSLGRMYIYVRVCVSSRVHLSTADAPQFMSPVVTLQRLATSILWGPCCHSSLCSGSNVRGETIHTGSVGPALWVPLSKPTANGSLSTPCSPLFAADAAAAAAQHTILGVPFGLRRPLLMTKYYARFGAFLFCACNHCVWTLYHGWERSKL